MLKNSSTLAVSVPIIFSIKLGFVSVYGPRETYFVDALHDWLLRNPVVHHCPYIRPSLDPILSKISQPLGTIRVKYVK